MTSEPDFYRKLYQNKFGGNDTKIFQIFGVPISNAKITRKIQFHPAALVIEYHQKSSNSSYLSILASVFHFISDAAGWNCTFLVIFALPSVTPKI